MNITSNIVKNVKGAFTREDQDWREVAEGGVCLGGHPSLPARRDALLDVLG